MAAFRAHQALFPGQTDTSSPDVAKAYGESVPHCLPRISEREGWIDLVNELDGQRKAAAQTNSLWEQFGGTLLSGLSQMKRLATCLWLINRQRDNLELLAEFREIAPGGKIHVLRNAYFCDERKFEPYNGSELRKEIEAAGGKSITFPSWPTGLPISSTPSASPWPKPVPTPRRWGAVQKSIAGERHAPNCSGRSGCDE